MSSELYPVVGGGGGRAGGGDRLDEGRVSDKDLVCAHFCVHECAESMTEDALLHLCACVSLPRKGSAKARLSKVRKRKQSYALARAVDT